MAKRDDILKAAESEFELHGFHAVPVDRVISSAQVSPRTLYAHFSSKEELAVSVLEQRHDRFLMQLERAALESAEAMEGIWSALADWLSNTRAVGCLFLRAQGEFANERVTSLVAKQKRDLVNMLRRYDIDAEALALLIEGATATAPVLGASRAVDIARKLWRGRAT